MSTFFLSLLFLLLLFAILLRAFWRDRKFLQRRPREVLRPEILDELKAEKEEFLRESAEFKHALESAKSQKAVPQNSDEL